MFKVVMYHADGKVYGLLADVYNLEKEGEVFKFEAWDRYREQLIGYELPDDVLRITVDGEVIWKREEEEEEDLTESFGRFVASSGNQE